MLTWQTKTNHLEFFLIHSTLHLHKSLKLEPVHMPMLVIIEMDLKNFCFQANVSYIKFFSECTCSYSIHACVPDTFTIRNDCKSQNVWLLIEWLTGLLFSRFPNIYIYNNTQITNMYWFISSNIYYLKQVLCIRVYSSNFTKGRNTSPHTHYIQEILKSRRYNYIPVRDVSSAWTLRSYILYWNLISTYVHVHSSVILFQSPI